MLKIARLFLNIDFACLLGVAKKHDLSMSNRFTQQCLKLARSYTAQQTKKHYDEPAGQSFQELKSATQSHNKLQRQ